MLLLHVENVDMANPDQQGLSAICTNELLPGVHAGLL